ncbi:MAG: SDR family oxidoreductase [Bacteroidia bacterium]
MAFPTSEKQRLKKQYGPWAVVTGASSGIGRALALRLAEAGIDLVVTARSVPLLDTLAASLRSSYGVSVRVVPADLADPAAVRALVAACADLDVGLLVAAAGYGTSGSFLDAVPETELDMIQVNCAAPLVLTRHFAGIFAQRGRGGIVLLGSLVGFQGVPYAAHYAATKAYVQSLAEALAVELRPRGVDVLAVAPAPVASGFAQRADMQMGMALRPEDIALPVLRSLGRRDTVLPGLLSKVLVWSLRTVPRWAKVRIMARIMGGMTQHQRDTRLPVGDASPGPLRA